MISHFISLKKTTALLAVVFLFTLIIFSLLIPFASQYAEDIYGAGISHLNVGSGEEISIINLAKLIKEIIGYDGVIKLNSNYPDGMKRKLLNASRFSKMGWNSRITLHDGIHSVYKWYLNNLKI